MRSAFRLAAREGNARLASASRSQALCHLVASDDMHSRTAASAKSLPVRLLAEPELAPGNAVAAAEAAAKAVLEAALEAARLHAMAREAGALRTAKSWPENDAQRCIPGTTTAQELQHTAAAASCVSSFARFIPFNRVVRPWHAAPSVVFHARPRVRQQGSKDAVQTRNSSLSLCPFSPLLLLFPPRSVHAESGVHRLNARSSQLTSRFLHMPSSIRAFSISWHLMTFTAAQLLRPRVSLFVCWQSRNLHRGMQRLQRRLRSLLQRLCWRLRWRPHGSMRWPGKPAPFGRRSRGLRMTRNAVSQAPQQHRSCSIPPLPLPVFTLSPVSSRLTGWCARGMLHRRLLFMPDPGLGSKEARMLCRLVTRPLSPLLLLFPLALSMLNLVFTA